MSDYRAGLRDITSLDRDIHIALVVSEFNSSYTEQLEQENRTFLESLGFQRITTYSVPWAFEIPGFTRKLLERDHYDLILTLWVIIRGETPHFDYVSSETARGIMDLTRTYDTAIIFGILTCNTEEQVRERIGHGFAIAGLNLLTEIQKL